MTCKKLLGKMGRGKKRKKAFSGGGKRQTSTKGGGKKQTSMKGGGKRKTSFKGGRWKKKHTGGLPKFVIDHLKKHHKYKIGSGKKKLPSFIVKSEKTPSKRFIQHLI